MPGVTKLVGPAAVGAALLLIGWMVGVYGTGIGAKEPGSYEECMLETMRGVPLAQSLYGMAEKVCERKFP